MVADHCPMAARGQSPFASRSLCRSPRLHKMARMPILDPCALPAGKFFASAELALLFSPRSPHMPTIGEGAKRQRQPAIPG